VSDSFLIQRLREGEDLTSRMEAADRIEALETENKLLREASQWRPIETAPKDGTKILAAIEGFYCAFLVQWGGDKWTTIDAGMSVKGRKVLTWRPIPSPPPHTGERR